jgi:hypothetical protein
LSFAFFLPPCLFPCESNLRLQRTGERTAQLESLGVTILNYIPHDTLLISAPHAMIDPISALVGVVWAAPLPNDAKLAGGYWSACRDVAEVVMPLWVYVELAPNRESDAVRNWPAELQLASFSKASCPVEFAPSASRASPVCAHWSLFSHSFVHRPWPPARPVAPACPLRDVRTQTPACCVVHPGRYHFPSSGEICLLTQTVPAVLARSMPIYVGFCPASSIVTGLGVDCRSECCTRARC